MAGEGYSNNIVEPSSNGVQLMPSTRSLMHPPPPKTIPPPPPPPSGAAVSPPSSRSMLSPPPRFTPSKTTSAPRLHDDYITIKETKSSSSRYINKADGIWGWRRP